MKRRYRIAIALAMFGGGVVAVGVLTAVSTGSSGPISSVLDRLGTALGAMEHRARSMLVGDGRSARLQWFSPLRGDAGWLRRPDRILLGAYDGEIPASLEGVVALEDSIGLTLPLIQVYVAWGDKPDQKFPQKLLTAIRDLGSVPVVTWEPWLTDFENSLHPGIALRDARDRHGLAAVARGDYDFYVDEWARAAARFGTPILVRLAHEMNDPYRYPWGPQNNTREEFIAAWRHVVERARLAGADNIIWVWSPHVAYEYWELYYPGSEWVDWVATGVLNFGPIAQWSQWWTFDEIFGRKYELLAAFGKPIMIAEFGTLAVGGDRAAWFRDALVDLPARHPAVRALLFFHVASDQTVTYQRVDWTVTGDSASLAEIRRAVAGWPAPAAVDRR